MRWDEHEDPKFGKRLHNGLLPTGPGIGTELRKADPTDVDRQPLQIFIDTTNRLLKQDVEGHERALFTPTDFAFEIIPERALLGPLFDLEETHVSTLFLRPALRVRFSLH